MLIGHIKDAEQAARGLLGPAIEALEIDSRHIVALEKERDDALADNAELMRLVDEHHGSCPRCWLAVTQEQSHPGAALLKEHRNALVRARNEGLEKAARMVESADDGVPLQMLADDGIRAMKEPEADGSSKVET
jgi:hypothetical protein